MSSYASAYQQLEHAIATTQETVVGVSGTRGELDLLAMRLPLRDPHVTTGPILSVEPRVLAVATDHPLAGRDTVCIEDLADYTVPDVPTLPREVMDAFIPPQTPSGQRLHRTASRAVAETPIRDMPASQTALVWLSSNRSAKTHAFARAATDVLESTRQRQQRQLP